MCLRTPRHILESVQAENAQADEAADRHVVGMFSEDKRIKQSESAGLPQAAHFPTNCDLHLYYSQM